MRGWWAYTHRNRLNQWWHWLATRDSKAAFAGISNALPAGATRRLESSRQSRNRLVFGASGTALALILFLLIPLEDTRPLTAQGEYARALLLFQQGYLAQAQAEAQLGAKRLKAEQPDWSARFQLLEAEAMARRGMNGEALSVLAAFQDHPISQEDTIREIAIESGAMPAQQLANANQKLSVAEELCSRADYSSCGEVLRARAILDFRQGKIEAAQDMFLKTLSFAQAHRDRVAEAGAATNLGFVSIQRGRFDEAVQRSTLARQEAAEIGSLYWEQLAEGNLGWAYFQLGDDEKALALFLHARETAKQIGDPRDESRWINTAGNVYRDLHNSARAAVCYREELQLAEDTANQSGEINALEELSQGSVLSGKLDEADSYIRKVASMELADGGAISPYLKLTQGMLAAARKQDQLAEVTFRELERDPASSTTTQLEAGDDLARLYESQGKSNDAEQEYKSVLSAFERAMSQLRNVNSRLPFGTNAARIYDDYIHLLMHQGRSGEALGVADQSRARTLTQSLGFDRGKIAARQTTFDPRRIAAKAGATLLFYWLGDTESYLWAVTPAQVEHFVLPAGAEIVAHANRYRKALLEVDDPIEARDEEGQALYKSLVVPALPLIRPEGRVVILADGELSQLNFETLLAPGAAPVGDKSAAPKATLHYWIDDATLVSAPSLAMLAAAKPAEGATRRLLLLGNPISPNDEFPTLPLFGFEMKTVQKHFAPRNVAVFALQQATPAAYLSSNPAQYSYIHFVSHAVASRTDPLDSAIILSGSRSDADSFKLYARDIMQRPIGARLVTISSCSGSGARSYAGEGLVGLSWAFLRAGAQSVIGALWEASDDSTPRLMDKLYQGLEDGSDPAVALRSAKLALLHSQGKFASPFYWAPFQLYTRR
jgi:CHAT domain-containing protein